MSEQTVGQRIVERWRTETPAFRDEGREYWTDLASRIDTELAKIADIAEIAKYLNSPDRPKPTLDLRGIHEASVDKHGEPSDAMGILYILKQIRTQLPDVEVRT